MVFNKTEEQEKEYLRQIINTINDSINNTDKSVKEHVDTLQEYKEYLWSNKDIDPHEIRSMRESILRHFATGESVIDKRKRLGKILDIPYFGRIDFTEKKEGCETMALYIGIHTFYDPSQKANLIYDWRAPISSMFYDHELGNASYSSPSGEVDGDISLKRQYRIRKGKMEYMIESSLTVHDDILQMPDGYDTVVGERGILLSGGQKQRVSIARIFLKNPRILILDEATSALDTATEVRIQSALNRLAQGRTTLVIAHRLSTIRNADCIMVVQDGKIAEAGTHAELMKIEGGHYRGLVEAQYRFMRRA